MPADIPLFKWIPLHAFLEVTMPFMQEIFVLLLKWLNRDFMYFFNYKSYAHFVLLDSENYQSLSTELRILQSHH